MATEKRVGYIRTVFDKKTHHDEDYWTWTPLKDWLEFWVGQLVSDFKSYGWRRTSPPPPGLRHHYCLGHANAADDVVLEWLLENSKPESWRLSRQDFTVYLSKAQVRDPANRQFLQRLKSEGVMTKTVTPSASTEYTADDRCDAAMLSDSDYLLEPSLQSFSALYRDSLRNNRPQLYPDEKLFYEDRLKAKMGHTWKNCCFPPYKSDAWRHIHAEEWKNYKCPSCGKRCKRSKGCKTTGEWWYEERTDWTPWRNGVDTSAPRPPDFEKAWRTLSAQDVCHGNGPDGVASQRFRNWKWQSVATFSGE
ncbi:hypothetical protein B0T10DRAFT_310604 [Thelonectria olida]|uniref:Uncharacterized protein n=1 Tax=Thelonectria olida TaxID=1576542 RepID=A0A9P8W6B0_9HYPO|nr:hypothetical protein B0T10DRAFT_310604 [Thelonectria olida]